MIRTSINAQIKLSCPFFRKSDFTNVLQADLRLSLHKSQDRDSNEAELALALALAPARPALCLLSLPYAALCLGPVPSALSVPCA